MPGTDNNKYYFIQGEISVMELLKEILCTGIVQKPASACLSYFHRPAKLNGSNS